jgi:hypothetical protein
MKIVHGQRTEEIVRVHKHRVGSFRYKRLLSDQPGTPGNFVLEMVHTTNDFFSPRHRHNFDQFRYQLEGEFDFDRNGKMKPGVLGYFPEGTPYGPQTSDVHSLTLVLQFGGASGSGYMASEQIEIGTEELKKHGTFEKGVFRRSGDVEGKRNMDGYQAIWEHVNQRPMVYPKPRYHDPLLMYPENYDWVPVEDAPGVETKLMGIFTERETECRFLRLDARARYAVPGRRIAFVLKGTGKVAGEPYEPYTATLGSKGEEARFEAATETEILILGLPKLEGVGERRLAAE